MSEEIFGAVIETAPPEEEFKTPPLSKKRIAKLLMAIRDGEPQDRPTMTALDFDLHGLAKGIARRAALAQKAKDWPGEGGKRIRRRLHDAAKVLRVQATIAERNLEVLVEADNRRFVGAMSTALATLPSQIEAIHRYFGNVSVKDGWIEATTSEVVFDGFSFGKFTICYEPIDKRWHVNAVTPITNPSDRQIVHPHVNGNRVCLGTGQVAHRNAIAQNRIFDMFLITDRILHTYERNTAYRPVSSWRPNYHVCMDCGDEGEMEHRCGCGNHLCDDCGKKCPRCERWRCASCTRRYPFKRCCGCDRMMCPGCLGLCVKCRRPLCIDCFSNGGHPDVCNSCHEASVARRQREEVRRAEQARATPEAAEPEVEHVGDEPAETAGGEGFFGADGLFGSQARLPQESPQSENPRQSPLQQRIDDVFGANPVVRSPNAEPEPNEDEEPYDDEPDDEPDEDWLDDRDDDDSRAGVARGIPELPVVGHGHSLPVEHGEEVVVSDTPSAEPTTDGLTGGGEEDALEPEHEAVRADRAARASRVLHDAVDRGIFPDGFQAESACRNCTSRSGCTILARRLAEISDAEGSGTH